MYEESNLGSANTVHIYIPGNSIHIENRALFPLGVSGYSDMVIHEDCLELVYDMDEVPTLEDEYTESDKRFVEILDVADRITETLNQSDYYVEIRTKSTLLRVLGEDF